MKNTVETHEGDMGQLGNYIGREKDSGAPRHAQLVDQCHSAPRGPHALWEQGLPGLGPPSRAGV